MYVTVRPKKGTLIFLAREASEITSDVEKALPLLRQLRGNLRHVFFLRRKYSES
jgi:hypothetical protein